MTGVLAELTWRGLVHQTTSEDLGAVLDSGPMTLYIGFDPSGSSLHVGHLLPIFVMRRFQQFGHRVIALVGGATGMIGDPSFKSEERNLLDLDTVRANAAALEQQMRKLMLPSPEPIFDNNINWLGQIGLLDFLRETGKHFSVNAMIAKDSVKSRLERDDQGISFTEFSYSLLQARDFLELNKRYGCLMQAGGSDQWGNIVPGIDLIRRATGQKAYGLTVPLLADSEGRKFGKTEAGTSVWLDPKRTSPYQFFQFWVNAPDADVATLLKFFTFLPRAEIDALIATVGSPEREAQNALAREITALIHGEAATAQAIKASKALFSGALADLSVAELEEIFPDVPSIEVDRSRLGQATLIDLLVETGACPSKGDARRQLQQNAIRVNGAAVTEDAPVQGDQFREGKFLVIKRGKRNNYLARLTG